MFTGMSSDNRPNVTYILPRFHFIFINHTSTHVHLQTIPNQKDTFCVVRITSSVLSTKPMYDARYKLETL